jgi:serine/threonine protein kinase
MHSNVYKCYLATDTALKNPFAVKISIYEDDEKRSKLIEEYELGSKLNHPNIPKFHKYFDDKFNEEIYIIMDLIEGKELEDSLFELN